MGHGTTGTRCTRFGDLNMKERRFAEEYIKDFNATQSALRAGLAKDNSGNCASVAGSQMLKKESVRDYIEQLMTAVSARCIADAEDIRQFWTTVMLDANESTNNRLKASDYLAKANGMYNTTSERNEAPTIIMDLGAPPEQLVIGYEEEDDETD